jgi:hypothetical protein
MWNYLGGKQGIHIFEHKDIEDYRLEIKCPYGVIGDELWVRETFCNLCPDDQGICYKADREHNPASDLCAAEWRPSIFMPRCASRHLLELIEEPIPQRLWDITEEDAIAEGAPAGYIEASPTIFDKGTPDYKETPKDYRKGFQRLWDSLNVKKYPWSGNYWVWRISFKEIEK